MNIRTIQQVNALGCCPCPFPECIPRKECQSISASASSAGFFDSANTSWIIYGKSVVEQIGTQSYSDTYTTVTGSSNETYYDEYSAPFDLTVGGCYSNTAVINALCFTSGNSTRVYTFPGGEFTEVSTRSQTGGDDPGEGCTWTDTTDFTDQSVTPNVTTTTSVNNTAATTFYGGFDADFVTTEFLDDPKTYAEWVTSAVAAAELHMDFEDGDCLTGTECSSRVESSGEPGTPWNQTVTMSMVKSRFRFGVPSGYTRSTWIMEWDYITATESWWTWYDSGATGTEPTPGPSLVSHETWTWAGDPDEPWSDWYEIPSPADGYETRAVNVQTICYASTRIGVKPTAFGDEVALP